MSCDLSEKKLATVMGWHREQSMQRIWHVHVEESHKEGDMQRLRKRQVGHGVKELCGTQSFMYVPNTVLGT